MDRDVITTRSLPDGSIGTGLSSGAGNTHSTSRSSKRFIFPGRMKGFNLKKLFKGSDNKQGRKTSKRQSARALGSEDDIDIDHSQFEDSPRSLVADSMAGGRSPMGENRGYRPTLNDILPTPTEKSVIAPSHTTPSVSTSGTTAGENSRYEDAVHTPKRSSSGGRQVFNIPDEQIRFEQVKCEANDGYSSDGSRGSTAFCGNDECCIERRKLRKYIEDLRGQVSEVETCTSWMRLAKSPEVV